MTKSNWRYLILSAGILLSVNVLPGCDAPDADSWYKGNLHTHSFWSDGDDFPEVIAEWYREAGYDFLAISDHNTVASDERWLNIATDHPRFATYQKYLASSPEGWVESIETDDSVLVRLKTYQEYSERFQSPGEFLMIPAEEVTSRFERKPIHVNASNVAEYIAPQTGSSVVDVMQKSVNAILEQGERLNRAVMPHINHPNFGWAIRADELAQVEGERFFEVYNGHPSVHNEGDSLRMSMERMWDVVNVIRLSEGLPMMLGIGVDDAHHYQEQAVSKANTGRGWVMVQSKGLSAEELISSMEEGRFYASSGVLLNSVVSDGGTISVEVEASEGVSYVIEFIGTRSATSSDPLSISRSEDGEVQTMHYSSDIGQVLQHSEGSSAHYTFQGDELYVRARITSTVVKDNPNYNAEYERAWTQPIRPIR